MQTIHYPSTFACIPLVKKIAPRSCAFAHQTSVIFFLPCLFRSTQREANATGGRCSYRWNSLLLLIAFFSLQCFAVYHMYHFYFPPTKSSFRTRISCNFVFALPARVSPAIAAAISTVLFVLFGYGNFMYVSPVFFFATPSIQDLFQFMIMRTFRKVLTCFGTSPDVVFLPLCSMVRVIQYTKCFKRNSALFFLLNFSLGFTPQETRLECLPISSVSVPLSNPNVWGKENLQKSKQILFHRYPVAWH